MTSQSRSLLDSPSDGMMTVCDRYFAPCVLAPFADEMARRLARLSTGSVLEVVAGTGILTRSMATALSAGSTIIATDPDAAMITHASARPGMARVTWQPADPRALPFQDGTFGIVTCLFGMATTDDRIAAFQEARRVIKQGGRFVFSILSGLQHNPVADRLQGGLNGVFQSNPPRYIGAGLYGYSNNEHIDDDLTAAGFTDAIYTTVELPFAAASAHEVAIGYCLGTPLRSEIEARGVTDVEPVLRAVTLALEQEFGTGPIEATMRAHIISAAG